MIINLLLIYPLDGGRILKGLFLFSFDYKKAMDVVNCISNFSLIMITFISSIGILYYRNISIVIFIFYLWYLVFVENKRKTIVDRMYRIIEKEGLKS